MDDEVWLKQRADIRRTSGYFSTEDMEQDTVDERRCLIDQAEMSDESAQQRVVQDFSLKSPADFTAPSTVRGEQHGKALNGDPTFTVTQNQLMEIVRRACSEVTTTSFSGSPLRPKQLSYCSPDVEVEADKQQPTSCQLESAVRGRSTAVRNSTESPPTRTHVRWRSPSADNDEFFDARQSLSRSRSRSRTPASRDRRSTSSSPPADRRPPNPNDDSGDDKDGENPGRRDGRRSQPPSPPPNRSGSTTSPQSWMKWMKPDKFNGAGSVETFLEQFDICCSYNSWNDGDKAAHLKCCLTGVAGQLPVSYTHLTLPTIYSV